MCCLFGLIDTRLRFTGKEKSKMLHALATVSEVRGTDATGIAYHTGEQLCIYKRPIPGHKLKFYMRDDTRVGMGHTRMTTQGKASKNRNNHPFHGIIRNKPFALAHNGVLYNDLDLRRKLGLPKTRIETDSYIGVQLIEQKGSLDFSSLRYMAEQVEGSFTFTVLDEGQPLYRQGGQPILPVLLSQMRPIPLCLHRRNPLSRHSADLRESREPLHSSGKIRGNFENFS